MISFAKALGLDTYKIEGNDVSKISLYSKKIIENIKRKNKPAFMILDTYRWLEHCGPNYDDNLKYRPSKEIKYWKNKCPLKKISTIIKKRKILNEKKMRKIEIIIDKEIKDAFNYAKKSKFPQKSELNKDIYAK